MHILIAPDSFKGSLSALQAAEAMQAGVSQAMPDARVTLCPLADGGEGTVDAMVAATAGKYITCRVHDPLGRSVNASFGLLGDRCTAVVEMAAASGLPLLRPDERDPNRASTYGAGELIAAALEALHQNGPGGKARPRLIIGLGGSATNDGGAGALMALGARFFDGSGALLPPCGSALSQLEHIDTSNLHPLLAETDLFVACDVTNPLCGPQGASAVFGPQKGALPEDVKLLDSALAKFAEVAEQVTGRSCATREGAGAAGGFGAGLLFFTDAVMQRGVDLVQDTVGFSSLCAAADVVLTGEGSTDAQTALGKVPFGVAQTAQKLGKPVFCLSGAVEPDSTILFTYGVSACISVAMGPASLETCVAKAEEWLALASENVMRIYTAGWLAGQSS